MAAVEDITSLDQRRPVDKRVMRTVALYADFFAMGLVVSVMGPTLVSLEIMFGVTTKQIALCVFGFSVGYTTGCLTAGLIYDRMNKELLFTVSLLLMAVSMAVSPFTSSLYGFVACLSVAGGASGISQTGGQSYIIWLWQGHTRQGPLIQGAQAMISVGATVGPFIVKPFLPDLSLLQTNVNNIPQENITMEAEYNITVAVSNPTLQIWPNVTVETFTSVMAADQVQADQVQADVAFVRFAFVATGGLVLLPCVICIVTFFKTRTSCYGNQGNRKHEKNNNNFNLRKEDTLFRIKFLIFGFIIFFVYRWAHNPPVNYLASFVVNGLRCPNSYGSLITSTFFSALVIGRVIAIPLSAVLSVGQMLVGDILVCLLGSVLMLFSTYHTAIIWISTAVAGLGLASFFPTAFLWASQYTTIDGRASAVFLIASSVGAMMNSYLMGYLFDTLGYMSLAYVMVAAGISVILLYVCAQIFVSYHRMHCLPYTETTDELDLKGAPLNSKKADYSTLQTRL